MNKRRLLKKALTAPKSFRFNDFEMLVQSFGFKESRIRGSHHIFTHPSIPDLVNIQEVDGEAKPYQIRQLMKLVERYDLRMEDEQ
jgi:predicted RNA binding protein YcfA (HicA-like mRNA interferase family)